MQFGVGSWTTPSLVRSRQDPIRLPITDTVPICTSTGPNDRTELRAEPDETLCCTWKGGKMQFTVACSLATSKDAMASGINTHRTCPDFTACSIHTSHAL